MKKDLTTIVNAFLPIGNAFKCKAFGNGLVHSTFLIESELTDNSYILQQINTTVFKDPGIIAANCANIQKAIAEQFPNLVSLAFLTTHSGELLHYDDEQKVWRMSIKIPDTITIEKITSPEQAYQTAFAFGEFSSRLDGNLSHTIKPSIPDFHNLVTRFKAFNNAIENTSKERFLEAKRWIEYLQSKSNLVDQYSKIISEEKIPLRIQHCDTKISNILFDELSQQPVCVIDWDTVMPGYFISDLGDMIRTIVPSCDENETPAEKMIFRLDYYEAIVKGYKAAIALTSKELVQISFAGRFMTYMQAVRFLTDYLNNDIYYTIAYDNHNLVRAKNQCYLLQLIEENT